jgi:hypothetical protein
MVSLILMVAGLVLVILGVLVLLAVVHLAVAWWLLLIVGAGLILLGWYLRSRPPSVV